MNYCESERKKDCSCIPVVVVDYCEQYIPFEEVAFVDVVDDRVDEGEVDAALEYEHLEAHKLGFGKERLVIVRVGDIEQRSLYFGS